MFPAAAAATAAAAVVNGAAAASSEIDQINSINSSIRLDDDVDGQLQQNRSPSYVLRYTTSLFERKTDSC